MWGTNAVKIENEFTAIEDIIKTASLDWDVVTERCYLADGSVVPKARITVRSDNRQVLGVVGERYTTLQNSEAFNWFQPFIDNKIASIEHAGTLKNGEIIFAQAKVNAAPEEIIKGDPVQPYITLLNSHSGVTSVFAGFFPRRLFCQNQLPSLKSSKMLKVKHTKGLHVSLEVIQKIMDAANQEFLATAEQYRFLASKAVNKNDLKKYITLVLKDENNEEDKEIRASRIERLEYLFEHGQGQSSKTRNYWGAFNAINESLNYEVGRSVDNRLHSLWTGASAKLNQRALDVALQLAN